MGRLVTSAALRAAPGTLAAPEVRDENDNFVQQALGFLETIAIHSLGNESAADYLVPVFGSGAPDPDMVESFLYVDEDAGTLYFMAAREPRAYSALN